MTPVTTTPAPEPTLADVLERLDQLAKQTAAASARFLSVDHAANYTGLSPKSVRRLLSSGKLTPLRPVRGAIRIDRRELDALVLASDGRPRSGRGIQP